MTEHDALQIARREIVALIQRSDQLSHFKFDPAELHSEYERCWVFAAGSEEMLEAGYAPAAVFVYLDKADGHRWTTEEIGEYFSQPRQPLRVAA